jgi:hypothetical protein
MTSSMRVQTVLLLPRTTNPAEQSGDGDPRDEEQLNDDAIDAQVKSCALLDLLQCLFYLMR